MPEEVKRWYPRFAGIAHPEVENAVRIILDKVYAERELTRELEARVNRKIGGLSGTFGSHAVRGALQTGGEAPLNVEGLLGKLAQPQIGGAATGTATPSVDDPVSQDGALFVLNPARSLYYFDGSSEPGTWRTLAAAGILPAGLRSAKPAAGNTGYMYFETDTGWLYYDNGTNYVYVAGIDKGTDATRTALTIGANDNGAVFYTTDTNVLWRVSAGAWTQMFVSLTAGISGILPVANGGTGLASGTSGGILGYTAAGTLASSILLTANAILLGGGAGATPIVLGSLGSTTTVLHGNAAGAPSFAAVALGTDVSGQLPTANGGTGQNSTATFPTSGVVVTEGATETLTNKTLTAPKLSFAKFTRSVVTVANGQNDNIDPLSSNFPNLIGPTAAFSITGFTGGTNGEVLFVYNTTLQTMTIKNQIGSSAGNQIVTLTGADVVLRASGRSFATFIYDTTAWVLTSTN